ncbi:Downstream target of A 2 [Hibiscus syriacus]|uniref:Downstream target of A 2 n=1 Tax=Hibiscus syriacus TaxID=106335 RepID=A0A6A3A723_HIBSY|nr:O-glucosyltransferase rumi homolog [Hibiscus syriacus]KAE8699736.1 Downstream target of A 2 [Hibiscus syriacus]
MAEHVKLFHCAWPYALKGLVSTTVTVLLFFSLFVFAALLNWMDIPIIRGTPFGQAIFTSISSGVHHERIEYPLNCSEHVVDLTCSDNYPSMFEPEESNTEACPDYFRWIHEDLKQWNSSGITKDMIERGIPSADNRLVIINGSAYVEKYKPSYQTRDVFTIWGILQLLRLYPGKVPDLDLLFYTGDNTVIMKRDYNGPNAASTPPPLFHYCGEAAALDIVFPDWTFWGWAEVNIMPWEQMLRAIKKGRERIKWEDREPYAFWKGNPYVAADRVDFLKCNLSDKNDWNVRLYKQDWNKEVAEGFNHSRLEDQCTHRYKVYIEGATWSVSEKYIMACDSVTLMVKPIYYDFFSRSMVPMQHFWPISRENKCRDIKFAVEWGNNRTHEAQAIGRAGSKYTEEMLSMRNVYDYMFHLLNEYSKLLKFKPMIPPNARRVCSETMACSNKDLWKEFMVQSMVKSPSDKLPCTLPPPYDLQAIQASLDARERIAKQVEKWETEYFEKN